MCQILSCFFLFWLFSNVLALPTDFNEKLYIVSDSSSYNYKTGINTYSGHVKLDQGSTHVLADRLTTKANRSHKIQEAIAYGTTGLAHYWTTPKIGEPELHADAYTIKYYPIDSRIVLLQNVVITQKENSFHGELILYNMQDETITVPASKNTRAVLIYNPDKTT